jgi:hypothetical protein
VLIAETNCEETNSEETVTDEKMTHPPTHHMYCPHLHESRAANKKTISEKSSPPITCIASPTFFPT